VQRQCAILIVGLDLLRFHGVCQGEAPAERTIYAFDAQVVFLVHLLLKLAFAANREDVVRNADVQVLLINFRQVRLNNLLILGLVNVHGRRPGG
jgi:hypothetical protein